MEEDNPPQGKMKSCSADQTRPGAGLADGCPSQRGRLNILLRLSTAGIGAWGDFYSNCVLCQDAIVWVRLEHTQPTTSY